MGKFKWWIFSMFCLTPFDPGYFEHFFTGLSKLNKTWKEQNVSNKFLFMSALFLWRYWMLEICPIYHNLLKIHYLRSSANFIFRLVSDSQMKGNIFSSFYIVSLNIEAKNCPKICSFSKKDSPRRNKDVLNPFPLSGLID